MGYWEEKAEYEEEAGSKRFCGECGQFLKERNVLGKCVECGDVICKNCGRIGDKTGKVVCKQCLADAKSLAKKGFWGKAFTQTKSQAKETQRQIKEIKQVKQTKSLGQNLWSGYKSLIGQKKSRRRLF